MDSGNRNSGGLGNGAAGVSSVYTGMRVEVLDEREKFLFEASVKVINDHLITLEKLSQTSGAEIGESVRVHLRGFHRARNYGVYMRARIERLARGQDTTWIVKDLLVTGTGRGRTFNRSPVQARAWIQPEKETRDVWEECAVTDVSSGGVCFRSAARLEKGASIRIRFRMRRGKEQPPLLCVVRRSEDRNGEWEYGCEFINLSAQVSGVIARTIVEVLANQQPR